MRIEQTAVIGAGTMGHALALVHALGGQRVSLHDSSPEVLRSAPALIEAASATLVDAGAVSASDARTALERITYTESLPDAVRDADLVVEAVVEKADVKRIVYDEIARHAPEYAIIASNTSYLDPFPLIPAARQSRAAIAHWYTPPYIIDLVDLAPGPDTAPEVIETLHALYQGFGKAPLVFDRLVPGYIANRLQQALNLECLRMIDEGWVSAEDIDQSIRHGLVHRLAVLGHMKKLDFTGLEMARLGIEGGTYEPPANMLQSPTLDRLIAAGRTGVRAGAGFYDYGDASADALFRERDLKLLRLKAQLKDLEGEDT